MNENKKKDSEYCPVESGHKNTEWPRKPPKKRRNNTFNIKIGSTKLYICVGEYPDGECCEIFLDLHKEGAPFRAMCNCFAIAVSLGLQYGVPLKTYVSFFSRMKFEPNGMVTGYPGIKKATSIPDFIFRLLSKEYIDPDSEDDAEDEELS